MRDHPSAPYGATSSRIIKGATGQFPGLNVAPDGVVMLQMSRAYKDDAPTELLDAS
jgi:hypothetical protein